MLGRVGAAADVQKRNTRLSHAADVFTRRNFHFHTTLPLVRPTPVSSRATRENALGISDSGSLRWLAAGKV